ncbi:hypothetical protein MAP00_004802 [Monascus purpureus]|nr:hypothetical protein MAP00_004802 [Monascus purpureus]
MRSTVLLPLFAFLARPILATDATYCSKQNTGSSFKANYSTFQSVGNCQDVCNAEYAFGILQKFYCWCSNDAPGDTTDVSDCNTGCPGYPNDPCGSLSDNLFAYIEMSLHAPSTTIGGTTSTTSTSSTSHSSTSSSSSSSSSSTITTTSAPAETTSSESVGQIVPITIHATPTSQPTVHPDHKSSGLSGGGIAGVVIGCVGGVALILAAVGFYIAKRRSRSRDTSYAGSVQNMLPDGRQRSSSTTMRMPTFTDNRLKTDTILFPNGRRDSSVSLQDNEDYSRPVLRLTNPD